MARRDRMYLGVFPYPRGDHVAASRHPPRRQCPRRWTNVGTATQVADALQKRFEARDGFNIMPPTLPGGLPNFVLLVIPELERCGLCLHEYEGATLRNNLGLPRPPGRHSRQVLRPFTGPHDDTSLCERGSTLDRSS